MDVMLEASEVTVLELFIFGYGSLIAVNETLKFLSV